MKHISVEVVVIVAIAAIALIAIFAPKPAHPFCADFTQCTPIKPRMDGALDPSTIIQQPLDVYTKRGEHVGEATKNPYGTNSMSNAYSPSGNQFSPSSLANEWGAGNEYYGSTVFGGERED